MPRIYIEHNILGVFAVDENKEILDVFLYPNDPEYIVDAILKLKNGEYTKELALLVDKVSEKKGYEIFTCDQKLSNILSSRVGITHVDLVVRFLNNLSDLAVKYGIVNDPAGYNELSHDISTLLARRSIQTAISNKETLIPPAIQLLEEIDVTLNNLSNRLEDWYRIHFPELGRRVPDHKKFAELVKELGDRHNYNLERLRDLSFKDNESHRILNSARDSMGTNITQTDMEAIQSFAKQVLVLYNYRGELSEYVSEFTKDIAPNISTLTGPLIAAKLLEKAGGLKMMAMMPASKIQVLGAEKALYRSRKTKAKPPKHGLIFQHPYVHNAPKGRRGSHARSLAAKIAIAARADAFSGNYIADELRAQLND